MLQFGGVPHPAALHPEVSQILLAVLVDLTDRRAAADSAGGHGHDAHQHEDRKHQIQGLKRPAEPPRPALEVIMMTTMPMSVTTTGRSS